MDSVFVVLGIVAVLFAIAVFNRTRDAKANAERQFFTIEGNGEFDAEVVGESHYQNALRKCVSGTGYVREEFSARVICENGNAHDANAIRIEIQGSVVGYLPRESAAAYRRILASNRMGDATGIARALIVGGGKDRPSYGVWLDM